MKILFTGASSHTGYWFIKELAEAGHDILATFRKGPKEYDGVRKERVEETLKFCKPIVGASFGEDSFLKLINEEKFDLICHHAADVTNLRSPDFNWSNALQNNTSNVRGFMDAMLESGCKNIIVTGSFYEANEGSGTEPMEAFNPYGLSKTLTWETFKYFAQAKGIHLGKFVIPITFGPLEDPKFVTYLVQSWIKGEIPTVKTPLYIRDNIHVTLLAKVYKKYTEDFVKGIGSSKINPSGYIKSQGDFAKQFAEEIGTRLGLDHPLELGIQVDFSEPMIRINTTYIDPKEYDWDEKKAWDELAKFYKGHYN